MSEGGVAAAGAASGAEADAEADVFDFPMIGLGLKDQR
jgi:hypothetical protein